MRTFMSMLLSACLYGIYILDVKVFKLSEFSALALIICIGIHWIISKSGRDE